MPGPTTGTWPPCSPSATAWSIAGWNPSSAPNESNGKRVYYLSIEFLIGRLLFDSLINLRLLGTARAALASLDVDSTSSASLSPTRRSATAGSAGSPPATWTAWRRWRCRLTATASATSTACSCRRSATAGSTSCRSAGWRRAIRGSSSGSRPNIPSASAAASNMSPAAATAPRAGCGIRPSGCWRWRTTRRSPDGAAATSTRCGCGRRARPRRCISRRSTPATWSAPRRRAPRPRRSRACSIRATPRRRDRSCGCARSISSPRRRCRTSSAAISSSTISLDSLPDHVAIQLNDTHPAIAVAELMRILVDEHDFSWSEAWRITQATLSYTNHTLLPEALESWPVSLLNRMLPRHMQIIYVINKLHLDGAVANGLADPETLAAISLIQEGEDKRARMGHLAFVGSHRTNGVSALHTDADAADRVPRPRPRGAGPHRQHDQRHQLPALAVRGQSDADQIAGRHARRDRARRSRPADRPRAVRRRRQFRPALCRHQASQQGGAGALHSGRRPASRSIRRRCSTCRSSASTNTSGSFSTSWRPSRFIWRSGWSRSATGRRG